MADSQSLGRTEAGEALISRLGVAGGDQEERGRRRRKRMEKAGLPQTGWPRSTRLGGEVHPEDRQMEQE